MTKHGVGYPVGDGSIHREYPKGVYIVSRVGGHLRLATNMVGSIVAPGAAIFLSFCCWSKQPPHAPPVPWRGAAWGPKRGYAGYH